MTITDRTELQKEFKQIRGKQQQERILLAKRIHEFRQVQNREQARKQSIRPAFDPAVLEKFEDKKKQQVQSSSQGQENKMRRSARVRKRTRNPDT